MVTNSAKQPPSETAETQKKISGKYSAREKAIALILTKVRYACSLPQLAGNDFKLALAAWTEALAPINPHWLDTCYLRAIRTHKGERPFGVYDIVREWAAAVASCEIEAWVQAGGNALARPDCDLCSNTGWRPAVINTDDSPVKRCECGR